MPDSPDPTVQAFIDRWHESGGHERGTAQQFLPTTGVNAPALSTQLGKNVPKREAQTQYLLNSRADLGQL